MAKAPTATINRYQAAKMIGCDGRTIDRLIERGELSGQKGENGTWEIPLSEVKALTVERGTETPSDNIDRQAADALNAATEINKNANAALQWLVKMQQDVIDQMSKQLGQTQSDYSKAIRAEAAQRLETEMAMRAESRKDKAVDEVLSFAPRLLENSVKARAGARMLDKLVALEDEQWDALSSIGVEMLGISKEDLELMGKLREERKAEQLGSKSSEPQPDQQPAAE